MKKIRSKTIWMMPVIGLCALFVVSCSDSKPEASYTMTVANLTNNQPLSPPAFVIHTDGYTVWKSANAASVGLEKLAESGDTSGLLDEAKTSPDVWATGAGGSVIGPGNSASIDMVSELVSADLRVSFAAMLVNTNDAFTGVADASIKGLQIDESLTLYTVAYDAGTEANSETVDTIPGPAAGGEGYNADMVGGFISVHPGVVTAADGLAASVLDESHRWRNPVARLTVTRTK